MLCLRLFCLLIILTNLACSSSSSKKDSTEEKKPQAESLNLDLVVEPSTVLSQSSLHQAQEADLLIRRTQALIKQTNHLLLQGTGPSQSLPSYSAPDLQEQIAKQSSTLRHYQQTLVP